MRTCDIQEGMNFTEHVPSRFPFPYFLPEYRGRSLRIFFCYRIGSGTPGRKGNLRMDLFLDSFLSEMETEPELNYESLESKVLVLCHSVEQQ